MGNLNEADIVANTMAASAHLMTGRPGPAQVLTEAVGARLKKLAALVAAGIEPMGHSREQPMIELIELCEGPHQSVTLNIDVSFRGICFGVYAFFRDSQAFVQERMEGLATRILCRFREAGPLVSHLAQKERDALDTVERTIVRAGSKIELVDLRLARWPLARQLILDGTLLMMSVRLLDASLKPYVQVLDGWSSVELRDELLDHVPGQRRRLKRLAKLREQGAAFEIDAIAENAIREAGGNISEIARKLAVTDGNGLSKPVPPSKSADETRIGMSDGVIRCHSPMADGVVISGSELSIERELPITLALGLVGRPATAVIDHPILRGAATISSVARAGERTIFRLRVKRRVVTATELAG